MALDDRSREDLEARLRASEETLRLAIEAGQLGIWDWDVANDTVSWTDRVYELHGVPKGAFGGRVADFAALVHPEDLPRVQARIAAALERDEPYYAEFRVPQRDGSVRWLATRARVLRDDQGAPVRMVGATYDITDRMRALEETERARAAAEEGNRAKDEFLAMLGHELRNPLAPIVSALHLMELRGGGAHAEERRIIQRQVGYLSRLVDDLLDVSRIARGKVSLDLKVVDLRAVVDHATEMTEPLYRDRRVPLRKRLPQSPVPVRGDFTRLAQVVANLLTNAAKFTPAERAVEVAVEPAGSEVAVRVTDQGCGIPREVLPRVFDLFVQGPQSGESGKTGLGLGLAIVKALAELHGGRVAAESEGVGRGCTFTMTLPRAAQKPAGPERAPRAPARLARSARVLVVDDNADAGETLAELLRLSGYETMLAGDAATALELAADFLPQVAILDIGLPDKSGYELAPELRRLPGLGAARLVALTGYGQARDRELAAQAGFDEHLVKPVTPELLFAALERLVAPAGEPAAGS